MANPIKTADLYNDTGELKKLIAELEEVQSKLESLRQSESSSAAKLETQVRKLTVATSQQREEIESTSQQADEISKRYKKYTESLGENAVKIAALKNAQRQINNVNKLEAKLLTEKEGSYNRLSAQYSLNKIRLNQLSSEERKNTKEGQKLVKTTNDIYQEMKRLQEETGKHTLSVGDYSKSIRDASKDQKRLAAELKELKELHAEAAKGTNLSAESYDQYNAKVKELTDQIDNLGTVTGKTSADFEDGLLDKLEGMDGATGDAVRGVKGLGQAFKALLANPVVLVIAAIVAGLSLLFSAFKRSAKGSELLAKGAALLDGTMSLIVGLVDTLIIGFEKLFNDPIGSIKEFGQSLVDNVLNRFKAIPKLLEAAGKAIKNLLTGNFDEAKEAAKDFGEAGVQALSGIDGEDQKAVVKGLKDLKNKIDENTSSFLALNDAKLATQRANRSLAKSIEELTTVEELQKSIQDDITKSFKEREAAQKSAQTALEARSAKEIQLAKNNLALVNTEVNLRRANGEEIEGLLDRQLEAYRSLAGAERAYTLAVRDNERTRDELKQDRLERDLDILIDGFDNQKSINERLLNDERLTLNERKSLLQDTAKLSDDSFAKQIETVQKFKGIAIDSNDLIKESDAVALNEKIRNLGLSKTIEGRLLEVIRDRRTANQDLAEAEIELAEKTRQARMKSLQNAQEIAKLDFDLVKRTEEEKVQFTIDQKQKQLDVINELNESQFDFLPKIDTSKLEAEINALNSKLSEAKKQTALAIFDEQQALADSEFKLLEKNEREKTQFRLEAEKARIQKILELNEKFGSDLSKTQLQILRNQIAAINNELGSLGKGDLVDIYDLFGFNLDDPEKAAITKAISFVKDQLSQLANTRAQIAQQNVQQANAEIAESQRALDIEIQNRNAGYANEVQTARQRLSEAKKNQKAALKEQEKAQKAQQRIQTIEQSVNLVTASTKIFSQVGNPLIAIPLIALMWGSFIASKIRASQLTKKKFERGGLEIIGGGSHASGNDTALPFQSEGKQAYGEAGEAHAIIPKGSTRKYRKVLPDIINSLRKGNFESKFGKMSGGASSDSAMYFLGSSSGSSADMSKVEEELSSIRKQGERNYSYDSNGRIKSERYKNLTRVYEY